MDFMKVKQVSAPQANGTYKRVYVISSDAYYWDGYCWVSNVAHALHMDRKQAQSELIRLNGIALSEHKVGAE